MTREEMINKWIIPAIKNTWNEKKCNEILKALEQEPCDDCIRRSAVLDINEHHHGQMPNHVNYEIWKEIKALPPVTPQPKMGRWKRISMDKYSEHAKYWYRCDRCGKDNLGNTDYCPNCGQPKMQEVEG